MAEEINETKENQPRDTKNFRKTILSASLRLKDRFTARGTKKCQVINLLFDTGCIKFGKYTLKSGIEAPFYINLRALAPEVRKPLCELVKHKFFRSQKDRENVVLAGVPYGALCLSYSIACKVDLYHRYSSKEKKSYGINDPDSDFDKEKFRLVIIDDVISSGTSIQDMIDTCKELGWNVKSAFVIIEREQNGIEKLRLHNKDIQFHYLFTISDVFKTLKRNGRINNETFDNCIKWTVENKINIDQ